MTIAEKITKGSDKTIFTLHREGLFYKCYNEDALKREKYFKTHYVKMFLRNRLNNWFRDSNQDSNLIPYIDTLISEAGG